MLARQAEAQQYHRGRFGEMKPVGFASVPEVTQPAPFFLKRTRTLW